MSVTRRRKTAVSVLLACGVAVAAYKGLINISFPYDPSNFASNSALVHNARGSADQLGDYLAADFTNNTRALFLKAVFNTTADWQQVSVGWPIQTPPSTEVCNASSSVPGCKPLAYMYPEQGPCDGSIAQYDLEFRLLPKSRPAGLFRVERFVSNWCIPWTSICFSNDYAPWFTTPDEDYFLRITADTNVRTRGENGYGAGDWSQRSLPNYCHSTSEGPYTPQHPD